MSQNTFSLWRLMLILHSQLCIKGLTSRAAPQTFPKPETLQYRNTVSYNYSKGNKHSQSNSCIVCSTFGRKGGKGWNLNLTFLMNSRITILLWQHQLQNSPHLGRGNRKSRGFGALNAQNGSSSAAPIKAWRL